MYGVIYFFHPMNNPDLVTILVFMTGLLDGIFSNGMSVVQIAFHFRVANGVKKLNYYY